MADNWNALGRQHDASCEVDWLGSRYHARDLGPGPSSSGTIALQRIFIDLESLQVAAGEHPASVEIVEPSRLDSDTFKPSPGSVTLAVQDDRYGVREGSSRSEWIAVGRWYVSRSERWRLRVRTAFRNAALFPNPDGLAWEVEFWAGAKGIRTTRRIDPTRSGIIVGRSQRDCDIVVDDSKVSGQHARIEIVRGRAIMHDIGSTNGIRVGLTRVDRSDLTRFVLAQGQIAEIGLSRFSVRDLGQTVTGSNQPIIEPLDPLHAAPAPPSDAPTAERSEPGDSLPEDSYVGRAAERGTEREQDPSFPIASRGRVSLPLSTADVGTRPASDPDDDSSGMYSEEDTVSEGSVETEFAQFPAASSASATSDASDDASGERNAVRPEGTAAKPPSVSQVVNPSVDALSSGVSAPGGLGSQGGPEPLGGPRLSAVYEPPTDSERRARRQRSDKLAAVLFTIVALAIVLVAFAVGWLLLSSAPAGGKL